MSTAKLLPDREALERFKETHPELKSALRIAALSEADFVQTYAPTFEGGTRQARRVHQMAVAIQQRAALFWANLKDTASPFIREALFNNIPQSFLDYQRSIPGYDRLFGSLDFIECDSTRSVLSPAAYFVDLMRFVEEAITERNQIPSECQLAQRRPDLFRLRLDGQNTNGLIPYIDLVNEVLETLVTTPTVPDAEQAIESAIFPSNLPFNFPLEEIRSYLRQLELVLPQLYQAFATQPGRQRLASQRERLNLSPHEFDLIRTEMVSPAELSAMYGFGEGRLDLAALAQVETFLARTGLTRQDLDALLFQDLDRHEVNAGQSRLFFINNVDDGLDYLTIEQGPGDPADSTRPPQETLVNLSVAKLDRLYRFLKLSRKLGWSFVDLDWALRSQQPAPSPERILQFDGVNDYVQIPSPAGQNNPLSQLQDTFTLEAWVNPSQPQFNPILSRGQEGNPAVHFLLCLDASGRLSFYANALGAAPPITSLQRLPVGQFSHVAVTVGEQLGAPQQSGQTQYALTFFINGQRDHTLPLPTVTPPAGDLEINIGRNLSDATFAGLIKDVRLWSTVRTADHIRNNRYQRLTGRETGLAGYWPLIEHPTHELQDLTPAQNHGVLGGELFVTQPRWTTQELVLCPLPELIRPLAYQFNGVDQYLAAQHVSGLDTPQLTLEAWIQLAAAGEHGILSKGNAGNRRTQFLLWVNGQGRLVFRSTSLPRTDGYASEQTITPGTLTHVSATVTTDAVQLYINGVLDRTYPLEAPVELAPQGDDLNVGRTFGDRYFHGLIQEVRIWDHARTAAQLNQFMHRTVPTSAPGLIGYWPLQQIEAGLAPDLSFNQNALYLGGVPADYQPDRVSVEPLLPELPVSVLDITLEFDGDEDILVLHHPQNQGLGQYDRLTLAFWFQPSPLSRRTSRQVLFSQGDAEAGLSIYLQQQRLFVVTWCADDGPTQVQETVLATPEAIASNQWHHLAVLVDETQSLDFVEFRAYLNGAPVAFDASTHLNTNLADDRKGFRLSPVGPAYLGGIDERGVTRFQGEYSESDDPFRYCLAGQITDLRVWSTVKSLADLERQRYRVPAPDDADLVHYLPLDEGQGIAVRDRIEGGYVGTIQGRDTVLAVSHTEPAIDNLHTHYSPADIDVLSWRDYTYRGRFFIPALPPQPIDDEGIGVTVLSRYPENIDQYYRLQVRWQDVQPRFELVAHPHEVQPVTVTTEAAESPQPTPDTWYRFAIEAEAQADATVLRIKLWPDQTAEPEGYQIEARDDSDIRIAAGTVGLWQRGRGGAAARFDDLSVVSLIDGTVLLAENFKDYGLDQDPTGWVDQGDRTVPTAASDLFGLLEVDGRTVLGTESTLDNIHTHYVPVEPMGADYVYTGRLRFTETNGEIGVTVFSRFPEGVDQYYSLRRDRTFHSFHLVAHPEGVQPLAAETDSELDSGLEPVPNTWYRFRIAVSASDTQTQVRAKVWPDGILEPEVYQMQAIDASDVRLRTGTVGAWAGGEGAKYFDDLKVLQTPLLSEDFASYGIDADPTDWLDTGESNGRQAEPSLFRTVEIDGNLAWGTESERLNIHSHYATPAALSWTNYVYTGKLRISDAAGGIGLTFLSRYPDPETDNHDQYYRLRRFVRSNRPGAEQAFHIAPHPQNRRLVDAERLNNSGVSPLPNVWYKVWLEIEDTGTQTQMRAKIWPEGAPEPAEFQINTFDDADNRRNRRLPRLTMGTVGVWAGFAGAKYFDDFHVRQAIFLSANLSRANLSRWQTTGSRNRFEVDERLFKTTRISEDAPGWSAVRDYPLLLRPLPGQALTFDGEREYLATATLMGLVGEAVTLEAWVNPAAQQANPVVSWRSEIGETSWFGLNTEGLLTLAIGAETVAGSVAIAADQFTHIALSLQADTAIFHVNGEVDTAVSLPSEIAFAADTFGPQLEIGRAFGSPYFTGQILEVRLWNVARTAADFTPEHRYQQPEGSDLIAYWAFPETSGELTLDASVHQHQLRLGGLEAARRPVLVERETAADTAWRDRRVVTFRDPSHYLEFADPDPELQRVKRYTVEVWFNARDKDISRRKQVIYRAGNNLRGLVIYLHDGYLYFGGYDRGVIGWQGTWLRTDRLESNRWHHAALVLDGRPEVRPDKFQGFLDGKLVDLGVGAQLTDLPLRLTLGGAVGPVRFHDGEDATNAYFDGAILELRQWQTARTPAEIAEARRHSLSGTEDALAIWWQFEALTDGQILDRSGHNRALRLMDDSRLQPLMFPAKTSLPAVNLDTAALAQLADIRQLSDRHRLSIERLVALWFGIRHTGHADQTVLFDRIFNPAGFRADPWDYFMAPLRWDVAGQELPSRDRALRSRLMGALQVSSDDLDRLVQHLSGDETSIELDSAYLTRLYQLSQLPKVWRFTVSQFFRLLDCLELDDVTDLATVRLLSDRVAEMSRADLTVDEVAFLSKDRPGLPVGYTETDIRILADELVRQSMDFLVRPNTFVADEISEFSSSQIVAVLQENGLIDASGAVTDRYAEPRDLRPVAIVQNWLATFATLPDGVSAQLQTAGFIDASGLVLRQDLDQVGAALADNHPSPAALVDIQATLVRQHNRQTTITETLMRYRDEHTNAVLAGLAELLRAEPALLQAVMAFFQDVGESLSDRSQFLARLMMLLENQPIPPDITDYLARLGKLLYVAAEFELTPAETGSLLRQPALFGVSNVFRPTFADVMSLSTFRELKSVFNDSEGRLVALLGTETAVVDAIVQLTGWDRQQLESLITHFGIERAANRLANLNRLQQAFALAERLQAPVELLIQLTNTDNLTLAFYQQQAATLLQLLRARYDDEQWPRVFRPLHDPLAVQKRDALLSLALLEIPEDFAGRRSPDLLSEYLLLDVQVGSEVETSRIVQGTAALQLYVQRCLMSLEKGVNPATIPMDNWEWMQNYRVWEANRKVFLYPESYIEPELRDTKTPQFEELEQALLQNDINQTTAERAFSQYLNKLVELADLQIVGAYLHREIAVAESRDPDETLYLLGRTATQPSRHYYRTLVNGTQWHPWHAIDLTINAPFISPVFAFNRLFLFWVEFIQVNRQGTDNQDNQTVYRPVVRYSSLDLTGAWVSPQTYTDVDRELSEAERAQPRWQRVYALRFFFGDRDRRERILVIYNDPDQVATLRNGRDREALALQFADRSPVTRVSYDLDLSLPFLGRIDDDDSLRNQLNLAASVRGLLDTLPASSGNGGRLIERIILDNIQSRFNSLAVTLSDNLVVTILDANRWQIIDRQQQFLIKAEDGHLSIYNLLRPFLHLTRTDDSNINDYAVANDPNLNLAITTDALRLDYSVVLDSPGDTALRRMFEVNRNQVNTDFSANHPLLGNLRLDSFLLDVNNQPGWYILDTGDEQFLLRAQTAQDITTDSERLSFPYDVPRTVFSFASPVALSADTATPRFRFDRLDTAAIQELSLILFREGLDGLLSLRSQQLPEQNFDTYGPNSDLVVPPQLSPDSREDTIDFTGAFGLYYEEVFFHIPFLIANQLNANQNFAEAQRWYHYIFNPTTPEPTDEASPNGDRYWQYRPFRNLSLETLAQILSNEAALAAYLNDPFDPHAIARLRINAYQKAIVMKYIDNLLDWGDSLFAQESRESINEAFLLYILAFNLLGPRPEARASQGFEEIGTYQGIQEAFDEVPEFLTDLDLNGHVAARTSTITLNQNGNIITTFCVPENAEFVSYWDRVEDRLFKIRHSLSIEGIFRQLALFQPPLDVRALVQATAAGGRDIGSLLSDLNVPVPHYRYAFMLERAKEIIGNVKDFGAALLDALEKRDAEQLAVLQTTHERNLLELMTTVRELERDEAQETLAALQVSRNNIQNRYDHFNNLIENGIGLASLSPEEVTELVLLGASRASRVGATIASTISAASFAVPNVITGSIIGLDPSFVTLVLSGGEAAGEVSGAIAQVAETTADILSTSGDLTGKIGGYKRRLNDWRLERATAGFDLQGIDRQIAITELQIQRAEQELRIQQRQIEQNQEIATFYRRKFTNEALYTWLISRLSWLYFQAYKLAYDFAKSAERALQYELPTNERFINFGHWDSLRRGLLAGESLMLDVHRMEKFHLDNDSRFQEIEKTIPLSRLNPAALMALIATGACEFSLSEALFDRDYPGHYFRIIKTIALSVKFREGSDLQNDPYLTLNSTLTQLGNKTLLDPDINAVRYLVGVEGAEQPNARTLRVNWRANQQIAVSSPRQDNGMFGSFDLNFVFDDRYFPFEGTGAVSNWHLEIPRETNPELARRAQGADVLDIEDVVIHLKYTSKYDRGAFKQAVQTEMQNLSQA